MDRLLLAEVSLMAKNETHPFFETWRSVRRGTCFVGTNDYRVPSVHYGRYRVARGRMRQDYRRKRQNVTLTGT
jgi:hypothetical protein